MNKATHFIHRLPLDLLAEVFVHWAVVDKDGPWIASLVCRLWRSVILSCPRAWSTIQLDLEDRRRVGPLDDDPEWCMEVEEYDPRGKRRPIPLWLERSGSAPLFLSLTLGRIYPPMTLVMDVIVRFATVMDRVEEIELGLESRILADALLDIFYDSAPALRHLTVKCGRLFQHGICAGWRLEEDEILKSLPKAIKRAPALHSLTLFDCMSPPGDGAYVRLRELSLVHVNCSSSRFLSFVRDCESLEVLRLSSCSFDCSTSTYAVLASLKTFEIRNGGSDGLDYLSTLLHAPKLETFVMRDRAYRSSILDSEDVDEKIQNIVKAVKDDAKTRGRLLVQFARHAPCVKSLILQNANIPDSALLACLGEFPDLRSLTLIGSFIGGKAFQVLSERPARGEVPVCQHLKTLTLQACPVVKGSMIKQFIEAREFFQYDCRLAQVNIHKCEKITEEDVIAAWICDPSGSLRIDYVPWVAEIAEEEWKDAAAEAQHATAEDEYIEDIEEVFEDREFCGLKDRLLGEEQSKPRKRIKIAHIYRDQDVAPAVESLGGTALVIHDMFWPGRSR